MDIISYISQCVAFQNDWGKDNWEKNKQEIYGNEETQEIARNVNLDEWLLQAIVWDFDDIIAGHHHDKLIYGRGHNHVWVSNKKNNKRLMMIIVRNNKLVVQFENPSEIPDIVGRPELKQEV